MHEDYKKSKDNNVDHLAKTTQYENKRAIAKFDSRVEKVELAITYTFNSLELIFDMKWDVLKTI